MGEGRSLALLYYLPYAILGGPAVPAALRLPNFLETLSRRFWLFEDLRKWWCFFCEKIVIRRYESNMHLDVGKNLANSKNWKVSRPNAACVHSIWNNEHVFPFRICKGGSRVKRKTWSFHLGLTEKIQGNWKSAWFLVFHLHPAVDQFTCFNIFHPCFGSELFRFTRLTSISSSTFSSNFLRYLCTWRKWK